MEPEGAVRLRVTVWSSVSVTERLAPSGSLGMYSKAKGAFRAPRSAPLTPLALVMPGAPLGSTAPSDTGMAWGRIRAGRTP